MFRISEVPTATNMARILIIDDSPVQRAVARLTLEEAGHQVQEAVDGKTGMEAACGQPLDCVLLDLMLPDMSGCEVLRGLKSHGVACPVIVLSADDPGDSKAECLALGAAMVIEKPRDSSELEAAIETVMGK